MHQLLNESRGLAEKCNHSTPPRPPNGVNSIWSVFVSDVFRGKFSPPKGIFSPQKTGDATEYTVKL